MILNVELSNKRMREIRDFSLTSKNIEEALREYHYTGENRVKDPVVENAKLPPITLTFYSFLFEFNSVPSQDELIDVYLSQEFFTEVSADYYSISYGSDNIEVSKEGLIARILRTYPSVVRDLHFYLMAVESNFFQSVWYSVDDDFKKGIDIRVKYKDNWYYVALLQNTTRSLYYKYKKINRHPETNAELIYIEVEKAQCKQCGDYYLCTLHHIEQLRNELERKSFNQETS